MLDKFNKKRNIYNYVSKKHKLRPLKNKYQTITFKPILMNMKKDDATATQVAILVPKTATGFFTALSFKHYLASLGMRNVTVIEVQPYQIKQVFIPTEIDGIYIGGLGLKNCPAQSLRSFIKKFSDKIAFWADHHPQHEEISELTQSNKRYLYYDALDDQAPSCTSLLNKLWGDKIIKPEWVKAANHLENPAKNPTTELAEQYKKIMYLAKVEDDSGESNNYTQELKDIFTKYLLSGGGTNKDEITRLLKKYHKIKPATAKAVQSIAPLHAEIPGVFVANSGEAEQVDKELILEALKPRETKHIVALQHHNLKGEPVTTILSSTVNLLALFAGSQPGAKEVNRIFLPENHEEVLRHITDRLISTQFKIEKN